jgi:1-acyl-sn-glycerol-3-phosphate acyltransferase
MIKAQHNKLAGLIFFPYMKRLLRRNFSAFYMANNFPVIPDDCSLVITPNHISWWDGFFIRHAVSQSCSRKIHIMMLEQQLNKYKFFSRLGAFSVNPLNPLSIITTKNYVTEILANTGNYVVIYPQGEIEAVEKTPLSVKSGLKYFVKGCSKKCLILPAAFKIQYYDKKHPAVIARFGSLIPADIVINDFDKYINEFNGNVKLLLEASYNKTFTGNCFD